MKTKGRKEGAKNLTLNDIIKIYTLHQKGVDDHTIGSALGWDKNTCVRAVKYMELAKSGDKQQLFDSFSGRNKLVKQAVWEYCNGKEEAAEEEKTQEKPDNTLAYLVAILEESKKQTELLKTLCNAWGAENE